MVSNHDFNLLWNYWYTVYYHVSCLKTVEVLLYMYCLFMSILRMNKIKLNPLQCGEHMSLQSTWYLHIFTVIGYRLPCLDFLHHLRISEDVVLKVEKRDTLQDPNTRSSACLDALFFHAVSRRKFPIPSMKSKKANWLPVATLFGRKKFVRDPNRLVGFFQRQQAVRLLEGKQSCQMLVVSESALGWCSLKVVTMETS